jgi:hypothetical protein
MRKRRKARGVSSPSEFYERLIMVIGWLVLAAIVGVIVWRLVSFLWPRLTFIHRIYTEPLKQIPMLPHKDGERLAGLGERIAFLG